MTEGGAGLRLGRPYEAMRAGEARQFQARVARSYGPDDGRLLRAGWVPGYR
jgi:hypothetical protein